MSTCTGTDCKNDAYRRRLCHPHWELDMLSRRKARAARDKAWRRAEPFDLEGWTKRQRHIVRAVMQRVEKDSTDLSAFAEMARLVKDMDDALGDLARTLHDQHDYSWTDFGDALGVSRQAARQRFGSPRK